MKKKLIRKIMFETPSIETYESSKPYNTSRAEILRNENTLFDDRPKKKKMKSVLDWSDKWD